MASGGLANEATAEALELPAILALIADGTATDVGKRLCLASTPTAAEAALRAAVERGEEMERLLGEGAIVPRVEEPLARAVRRLADDRLGLGVEELVHLRLLLRVVAGAVDRIRGADPACPRLAELVATLSDLSSLRDSLEKTLDDRGEVREDASRALLSLSKQTRRARAAAYKELERVLREHREEIAEETIPVHGDRLVLLLRSGAKGKVRGLVHGRSGSGKSYYFEPFSAVEANNRLQEARQAAEVERQRLLQELITSAYENRDALEHQLQVLAEVDRCQAAARFATAGKARWLVPSERASLRLAGARHPLLDPRLADRRERVLGTAGHTEPVVPLSVELDDECRILVVTGPNAGGKTVALKTVGLTLLLAHCGLPVPVATGSTVPLLERVEAIVGDEQNLLADLSTFSGRLLRLGDAWAAAGPRCLTLIDELGSGTDPEEGGALGVALLEGLLQRGGMAIITSHLTRLAAAALDMECAACAAMAFDASSGNPTYELVPGAPGASEALSLARRLGLAREWVDRAEELLGSEHGRLQRLLAEVEEHREELARGLDEAAGHQRRLQAERQEVAELREALEGKRERLASTSREELAAFRRKVKAQLRGELESMREAVESGRRRGLVERATESLFAEAPVVAEPVADGVGVVVGSQVRHQSLGWRGRVVEIERERATVAVHGKRVRCRLRELTLENVAPSRPTVRREDETKSHPGVERELHLRGQRVEEALEELDRYLDRCLLASLHEVRIVHGHGSGKLKRAVRESLREHVAVESWRPGEPREGGDGATVVVLAG